jgi:hypothetical protein
MFTYKKIAIQKRFRLNIKNIDTMLEEKYLKLQIFGFIMRLVPMSR